MLHNKILSLLLFALLMVFSSCSGGGGSSSSSGTTAPVSYYELDDKTKIVESSDADLIINVPEINSSNFQNNLDFTVPNSGVFANYTVGDTLMSGVSDKAPYGFLRKITSIQDNGNQLVFSTEQASLLEATNNIDIDYNSGTISTTDIKTIQLAAGVSLLNMELEKSGAISRASASTGGALFDISIDQTFSDSNGNKIVISGRTTFDFGVFFKLTTSYIVIPDVFRAGVEIEQGTTLSVVSQNGITYDERISLGSIYLAPITFGAIVIVPTIELVLKASGEVAANFSMKASESFDGKLGVEYIADRSTSWGIIHEYNPTTDFIPPNLEDVGARLKVNAGPEFSLLVYGIVGPYSFVSGFAELEATVTTAPKLNLTLDVGAEYELGVKYDILWVHGVYELANRDLFRVSILNLANEAIPDNIYLSDPMDGEFILFGPAKIITTTFTGTQPTKVDFFLDDVKLGEDLSSPFIASWDTNQSILGLHTIKVISYDSSGTEIGNDSSTIELKEAKWRENVDVGDLTEIGHSDFLYNTGYVFGLNASSSIIKQTTDGGKSWSMFFENSFVNGFALKQGFIGKDGNIIGLELLTTKIINIQKTGRTSIYAGDDVLDMRLNSAKDIVTILRDDAGLDYIATINEDGHTINTTPIRAQNGDEINTFGLKRLAFNTKSTKGIMYGGRHVDNVAGTITDGFMLSNDDGKTWGDWADYGSISFDFLDAIEGADFIDDDNIILSGVTYVQKDIYDSNGQLINIALLPDTAFILKTTDGGVSWIRVNVPQAKGFHSVSFYSETEGYAAVYDETTSAEPKVYKTEDGGLTWSPVLEVSTTQRIVRVQFSNEYSGVAVGDKGSVFRFSLD